MWILLTNDKYESGKKATYLRKHSVKDEVTFILPSIAITVKYARAATRNGIKNLKIKSQF